MSRAARESWQKSRHRMTATCADCHLPHDFVGKWVAKVENGWNHSRAFTTGRFREPIVINARNSRILQRNCFDCHVDRLAHLEVASEAPPSCVHCHASVGHGERAGLGAPLARRSQEEER